MKTCYWAPVPDMRGKKTMPYTDIVVFNAKEKLDESFDLKLAKQEADEWNPDDLWCDYYDYDDLLPGWKPSWED